MVRPLIDKWNAAHPNEKVTFKEQTDQADQQHDDLVQHFQAKDPGYDVASVDVVWTAEFAAKGWLQPLKDKMALDTSAMLKPTVEAASYKGTLYAAPESSDGGILYYRKDLVPTPPKTWDEMMSMCSIAKTNNIGCYAGQFKKYEGLTVNASEAINSAGGAVLDEDGKPNLLTARGQGRHGQPGQGLRRWQHPEGSHHLPGGGGPPGLPGRQAAVPAQLALRLQPGHHRRLLQGQGQVWA